MLIFHSVMINQ